MKTIRFLIPIFLISQNHEKYIITEKSFKYYLHLKNLFKNELIMDFTIIGSEDSLSRELTLKYFNNINSYIEFNQGNINYFNRGPGTTLNTVVGNKIKTGYDICRGHNPDMIIFIKSNHFISYDCLKFVTDNINYNNFFTLPVHSNVCIYGTLNNDYKMDYSDTYVYSHVKNDNNIACFISLPRNVYTNYEMNPYDLTECSISTDIIKCGYNPYMLSNFYIFNIKSKDDYSNVTLMSYLRDKTLQNNTVYKIIKPDNLIKINDDNSVLLENMTIEEKQFFFKLISDTNLIYNSL